MLKENLYAIFLDLDAIEKSSKDILTRKVEEKISKNIDLYRDKIEKTFRHMLEANYLATKNNLKKISRKTRVK